MTLAAYRFETSRTLIFEKTLGSGIEGRRRTAGIRFCDGGLAKKEGDCANGGERETSRGGLTWHKGGDDLWGIE